MSVFVFRLRATGNFFLVRLRFLRDDNRSCGGIGRNELPSSPNKESESKFCFLGRGSPTVEDEATEGVARRLAPVEFFTDIGRTAVDVFDLIFFATFDNDFVDLDCS